MRHLNSRLASSDFPGFQNILLEFLNSNKQETKNGEISIRCIDDYALLQHKIISKTYFIETKDGEESSKSSKSEEYDLPQLPPLKLNKQDVPHSDNEDYTELQNLLCENKPGLLDSDWITEVREAYIASSDIIKVNVLISNLILYKFISLTSIDFIK